MTRRDDFMLPWGREDVGMLSLKRHEKEYSTHRQWLKSQKAVVSSGQDGGSLESLASAHELFNSGKKSQLRLERQREVDYGNHKMVESMADTLRKVRPARPQPINITDVFAASVLHLASLKVIFYKALPPLLCNLLGWADDAAGVGAALHQTCGRSGHHKSPKGHRQNRRRESAHR
jgi:hypothetical protein